MRVLTDLIGEGRGRVAKKNQTRKVRNYGLYQPRWDYFRFGKGDAENSSDTNDGRTGGSADRASVVPGAQQSAGAGRWGIGEIGSGSVFDYRKGERKDEVIG